jgi:hypothetical protein
MLAADAAGRQGLLAPEPERIVVGCLVLGAVAWGGWSIVVSAPQAWPWIGLWFTTRLGPVRFARLVLFCEIRDRHARLVAAANDPESGSALFGAAINAIQEKLDLGPDQLAFAVADNLAPVLVSHLLRRLLLVVLPLAAAIVYYRLAVYPVLVRHFGGGLDPVHSALRPVEFLWRLVVQLSD